MNAEEEQVANVMLLVATVRYTGCGEARGFDAMKSHTAAWTGVNAREDEHLFLRGFLITQNQPESQRENQP